MTQSVAPAWASSVLVKAVTSRPDDGRAVLGELREGDGPVAVGREQLAGRVGGLAHGLELRRGQPDKVHAAAVAAREVDAVVAALHARLDLDRVAQRAKCHGVVHELFGVLGEEVGPHAARVDGHGAAGDGRERDLEARLLEDVVGLGQLREPEARGVPAHGRGRRGDEEDLLGGHGRCGS